MNEQLSKLSNDDLWKIYGMTIKNLKERELIRTRNITSERGEYIVINHYNKTPNMPKLQRAPTGTKNIDAISRNGDRYAIKTITHPHKITGVFYGLQPPKSKEENERKFEYLVVVTVDEEFQPVEILEAPWKVFLKYKRWHSRMRAWNMSVSKRFKSECRIVYRRGAKK